MLPQNEVSLLEVAMPLPIVWYEGITQHVTSSNIAANRIATVAEDSHDGNASVITIATTLVLLQKFSLMQQLK